MGNFLALCRTSSESCIAGAGVSKKATGNLSQDHELKAGRLYHLLPSLCSPPEVSSPGSVIKRIKVVITKQQLQQLVNKQISLEDLLSEVQTVNLTSNRGTELDSIPEETE